EERGSCVTDVLDVCVGVLELPRLPAALTEVAVIECERCMSTRCHRTRVGTRRLLLHRRKRTDGDHRADRLAAVGQEEVTDQPLAFRLEREPALTQLHACKLPFCAVLARQ